MRDGAGIFISATIIFRGKDPENWRVDESMIDRLIDHAALGRRVFIVFYHDDYEFGKRDESEILSIIRSAFYEGCGIEIKFTIMFIASLLDPAPFWEKARCHGIDMSRSVLVAESEQGKKLGDIIEIGYFNYPDDFLLFMY